MPSMLLKYLLLYSTASGGMSGNLYHRPCFLLILLPLQVRVQLCVKRTKGDT
ncbi:unnamed protein product [Moneuplotes crassus]|uniref:Uncharacterized protein n=1 Tax=Euplotes crassus TaxID=5936 RepID=A0AAD1Y4G3_EUPCR|nr:unnamed protein product [Moneuplotes crassus]